MDTVLFALGAFVAIIAGAVFVFIILPLKTIALFAALDRVGSMSPAQIAKGVLKVALVSAFLVMALVSMLPRN